jgi:hypothetical protein
MYVYARPYMTFTMQMNRDAKQLTDLQMHLSESGCVYDEVWLLPLYTAYSVCI